MNAAQLATYLMMGGLIIAQVGRAVTSGYELDLVIITVLAVTITINQMHISLLKKRLQR